MFKVPEQFRLIKSALFGSTKEDGNNGFFIIPFTDRNGLEAIYNCMASDGLQWEHVSVHVEYLGLGTRTPSWDEMCQIKDFFWDDDDWVMQFHPAKKDYVNHHKNVLHLWRSTNQKFNFPEPILVGLKMKQ